MASSSPKTWAQERKINQSSNQQSQQNSSIDTPLPLSKQLDENTVPTSPEIESSCFNPADNHRENEVESQLCTKKETYEALEQRCRQLQEDIEVLATHMDKQDGIYKRERKKADDERLVLLQRNASLEREVDSLLVEKDALLKQSARLTAQCADEEQQANDAREAHDELLSALAHQQQQTEDFQTAAISARQDRVEMREALNKTQMLCCRLEEELASAHTQVLNFQNERDTLQAVLDATVTGAASLEARQLQAQDEVIASLRADLMQTEFELKTLLVDKVTLEEKLQQRSASSHYANFDVIPLDGDNIAKRKGSKKRTTIRPVKANKEAINRRGSDIFNNLMELPNSVTESQDCAHATTSSSEGQKDQDLRQGRSFRDRIAPPSGLTSFVAKTVQSARKHLATPLQNTFGSS